MNGATRFDKSIVSARKGVVLPGGSRQRAYRLAPVAAAVVAILHPQTTFAAERALEEIIVTATKREMSIQDLGQAVSALTAEDLQKQSVLRMEDYVRSLPSVSLAASSPGRNMLIIRGVSQGISEAWSDAQVSVYLDESPVTSISQEVDVRMVDINRVETLPGPQGTLFGSSSQAGTIRIITNQPDATAFSSAVSATVGTTKGGAASYDVNGWVNIPLVEGKLALRAVLYDSHEGGYVDNVLGGDPANTGRTNADVVEDDQNEVDATGGRISALWTVNEDWDLDLMYIMQSQDVHGTWESDPSLDGDFEITRFFDDIHKDDWYQASASLTGDLGFAELTLNAAFFERDIAYAFDNALYEQFKASYWGYWGYPLYNPDYTIGYAFNDQGASRTSTELRLTSQGDSRFQWMMGGFYEDLTIEWYYGGKNPDFVGTTAWYAANYYACYYAQLGYDVQCPLPETDILWAEDYSNNVKQTAIFGEVGYDLTPDWNVTLGGRWFRVDRTVELTHEYPGGMPPLGSFDNGGHTESAGVDEDTVFKLGTTYQFTDDIMAYALYSEGFRLGGHNSQRAAATGYVPATYMSDKVGNYEVGFKSQLFDDRLSLNVTAFRLVWDKIQVNQSGVSGRWWLRGVINGGEAKNEGFEVSTEWYPVDNLLLSVDATFNDARFTDDVARQNDVIPAGTPMIWSADRQYHAAIEYTIPEVLGGDLWFRYDYSYESEKWLDVYYVINDVPAGLVPSSELSNFHVGLNLTDGWQVQADVYNLWDQRTVNFISPGYAYQAEWMGDPRWRDIRSYVKPRTVSLTVTKYFE